MKILHFIYGLSIGGAETFLLNMLSAIDTSIFSFGFAIQNSEIKNESLYKLIRDNNWPIHVIPQFNKAPIAHFKAIKKLLKEGHYDAIHIHMNAIINPLPLIAAKRLRIKTFIHSHSTSPGMSRQTLGKLIHNFNKRTFIHNQNLLACSQEAGRWMFDHRSFKIIYNAVDIERFLFSETLRRRIRELSSIPNSSITIGSVGRLTPPKNHFFIIGLFNEFLKTHSDSRLLLVGDGPLRTELENSVKDLGISDNVIFIGAKENPEEYYSAFDLFLFPSQWEGIGFTAIEAQTSGLPIIASDCIPKVFDVFSETRFLGLESPLSEWVKAMEIAITQWNSKDRVALGKRMLKTNFNIQNSVKQLEKIYLS